MHNPALRRDALELSRYGRNASQISRELAVARSTVRYWLEHQVSRSRASPCFLCQGIPCPHPDTYVYLLGQYLGDGYLVTTSRVPRLRIACSDKYPAIAAEVDAAMRTISGNNVLAIARIGCSDRGANWTHWPCLFPQHGPGLKHTRRIELAPWQDELASDHPWSLLRGLFQSDGSRSMNRVVVRGQPYAYPRYFFSNESRDILDIAGRTLNLVGVEWRYNRPNSISVARRGSVALLDDHIGPKA